MKGVIDRFEGNYAVVLCGDKEIRMDVSRELLPGQAEEGDWMNISFDLDPGGTADRRERANLLLNKLKKK